MRIRELYLIYAIFHVEPVLNVTVDAVNVRAVVGSMASLVCRLVCCEGAVLIWSKSNGQTLPSRAMV